MWTVWRLLQPLPPARCNIPHLCSARWTCTMGRSELPLRDARRRDEAPLAAAAAAAAAPTGWRSVSQRSCPDLRRIANTHTHNTHTHTHTHTHTTHTESHECACAPIAQCKLIAAIDTHRQHSWNQKGSSSTQPCAHISPACTPTQQQVQRLDQHTQGGSTHPTESGHTNHAAQALISKCHNIQVSYAGMFPQQQE